MPGIVRDQSKIRRRSGGGDEAIAVTERSACLYLIQDWRRRTHPSVPFPFNLLHDCEERIVVGQPRNPPNQTAQRCWLSRRAPASSSAPTPPKPPFADWAAGSSPAQQCATRSCSHGESTLGAPTRQAVFPEPFSPSLRTSATAEHQNAHSLSAGGLATPRPPNALLHQPLRLAGLSVERTGSRWRCTRGLVGGHGGALTYIENR